MAMAMASAAAHTAPPFPLPKLPRVRPPPIPKGTPGPNTIPQPVTSEAPKGKVWADGRWRDPRSSSAKHKRAVHSRQLEKALRHEIHGMNIYAYRNSETNQVVYSLTKIMQNTKILKQLVFHGKKTVAPRLRRDMWRPYFSIHFPETPSGAAKGLRCYQELRELSLRRQLDPPKELITASQKDFENHKFEHFAPDEWTSVMNKTPQTVREKTPWPDKLLPLWLRSKRLMDMRGSSVADVSAVLARHADLEKVKTPVQWLKANLQDRKAREAGLSRRARLRLNRIRSAEQEKEDEINNRKASFLNPEEQSDIDVYSKARIALEYEGPANAGDLTHRRGERVLSEAGKELDLLYRKDFESDIEQSPVLLLEARSRQMRAEKKTFLQAHEAELSAEIEKLSQSMSEQERVDLHLQIEQERQRNLSEYDEKLTEATQKLNEQREDLRAKIARLEARPNARPHHTKDLRAELRKLSRTKTTALIGQLKHEKDIETIYVGPLAAFRKQRDDGLAAIESRYKDEFISLQRGIAAIENDERQHEVLVLWADMRDGSYVSSWPETVRHEELQPKGAVQKVKLAVRQHEYIDEDEEIVSEQRARRTVQLASTVHVFGSEKPSAKGETGRWLTSEDLASLHAQQRAQRAVDWSTTESVLVRKALSEKRAAQQESLTRFADTVPESLQYLSALFQYLESLQAEFTELDAIRKEAGQNAEESRQVIGKEEDIRGILKWLSIDVLPEASNEITRHNTEPASEQPISTSRLDWARAQIELLNIELKYPEARQQANLWDNFESQFTTRAATESRIEHLRRVIAASQIADIKSASDDEIASVSEDLVARYRYNILGAPTAIQGAIQSLVDETNNLVTFDRDNPTPKSLQDREAVLREEIAEKEQDLANMVASIPEPPEAAEEHQQTVKDLRQAIEADTTAIARLKTEAWIQFKRGDGYVSLSNDSFGGDNAAQTPPGQQPEGQKASNPEEQVRSEVVQMEQPTLWGRVKGVFGRK